MASKRYSDAVMSELSDSAFFRPTPPAAEAKAEVIPEESSQVPARSERKTSQPNPTTLEPWNLGTLELDQIVIPIKPIFDISEPAFQSNTYSFTTAELNAIEDLNLELQRKLDIKATKYDIVRCGV